MMSPIRKLKNNPVKPRNPAAYGLAIRGGRGAGTHANREYEALKGYIRKDKYPKMEEE